MPVTSPWDLLVDERTGVVTGTEQYLNPPEWPTEFRIVAGHVSYPGHDRPWVSDRISTGTAFGSVQAATVSALGEAVERYCGNFVPSGLDRASWSGLRDAGVRALDPRDVLLYSDEQYATPGFPFTRFERDTQVLWTAGHDMVDGTRVAVPASLVWCNYFVGPRLREPCTNFVIFAGIAAGQNRRHAETAAMEEIIERDAVELWWDAGGTAVGIDLPDDLAAWLAADDEQLSYQALAISGPWRVPVVGVVARDPELDLVTLGTAARANAWDAVLKAAGEAVALRSYAKGMLDPGSGAWRAAELGLVDGTALKPYREDRRYLDDYADDFHDVTDLMCQTQIYLDPRTRPWTAHLLEPQSRIPIDGLPRVDADPWEAYRDELCRVGGHTPISVDVTTADVAEAGLSVARVVAPGTYTNAPAGFACRAGERRANRNLRPLPHT